ncbi:helix-turn-helix transcriptional regulator [Actinokineospora sp. NBRC 105648]|uniref:helix-turn-helix domain-containing protein n=1 Tax=Actinokineospora sp. NBRC 105648 TaxID=3032206 RepID=UPI0024A05957|nr:helix-turn-helix transcriptional regulator [Actinokineospora sp. NBRC 105648]GLZ39897.1 hypothetical protein Acsp05_35210 [Actinokineospora sp. NBRC 105648]
MQTDLDVEAATEQTPPEPPTAGRPLAPRDDAFPEALRRAVEARGCTLEEMQGWLAEHDVRVSLPTLSYWRSGRSRPERSTSLRAVRLLEHYLGLRSDALVSLLGPRRARGRWAAGRPGGTARAAVPDDPALLDALAAIGITPLGRVRRVSTSVTVTVNSERLVTAIHLRDLVRADRDGNSRCAVTHLTDEDPSNTPVLEQVRNCRIGRVHVNRSTGMTAAELILDRVLEPGEPALLEYQWRFPSGLAMVNYEHRFAQPVREFVLQVRFEPDAVPAQCRRYVRRTPAAAEESRGDLWIGGSHTALLAESGLPAGVFGVRWAWPSP